MNVRVILICVCLAVVAMYICVRAHTSDVIDNPPLISSKNIVSLSISGHVNPSIIVPFKIGSYKSVFMLDTGYAGAPVLNTKILHIKMDENDIDSYLVKVSEARASNDVAYRNMQAFKSKNKCIDYTSGCVLRLMGIGETSEKASDMLLCPHIAMKSAASSGYLNVKKNVGIPQADVLMTNHELNSPHILTLDYLRHVAPCMLYLKSGFMTLAMGSTEFLYERAQCTHISSETIGGAYVCSINISGVNVRCTVDTGASTTICVGAPVLKRLQNYKMTNEHIEQVGINAEVICSDIVRCDVEFANMSFHDLPVFVNQQNVEETDGYVGLGFLKAFNLLVTPMSLFAQFNGAPVASLDSYDNVRRQGTCS